MGHAQAQETEAKDEISASSEVDTPAGGTETPSPQPADAGEMPPDGASGSDTALSDMEHPS